MAKTGKELREELSNLLSGIMQTNSSFAIANLSQKIVEVTKEWKEARELEEAQKSKPEPKDVKIKLYGDIITKHYDTGQVFYFLEIQEKDSMPHDIVEMAGKLLQAITAVEFPEHTGSIPEIRLRNYLIQILEEKFGLAIKICGNCKKYQKDLSSGDYDGRCILNNSIRRFGWPCKDDESGGVGKWAPKEIPEEKKKEEKI